uniref:Uncharacterized protein n=1 Tax=Anguilla anguilla TaxID=7936 RepID=A0A0E9Q498_ANGAN
MPLAPPLKKAFYAVCVNFSSRIGSNNGVDQGYSGRVWPCGSLPHTVRL